MGKTILTPKQSKFLELAQTQASIAKNFYLTGGTALSEFYLQHRLSEDIDLFSELKEVGPGTVDTFLKKVSPKLSVKSIKRSQFLGLFSYTLIYDDGEELKVDFSYYPFPLIGRGVKHKNLRIDSIHDIAVNKLHTLFMKPRTRDYIDLYFIVRAEEYSLNKLILDAKAKFDWDIDKINLGSQFLKVKEFTDYPKMLIPFDRKKMEKFFLELARSLGKDIFKE